MPRRSAPLPDLKYHSASKQWCVYLHGKRVNLGRDEAAARTRYKALCRDLLDDKPVTPAAPRPAASLTVKEALTRYLRDHAYTYYRDQPATIARIEEMVGAVNHECASLPADKFRGPQLKAVRRWLITERVSRRKGDKGRPLSRTYINHLVRAAKQAWQWLLSEGEVTADCAASVCAVQDLHRGKGGRETERVTPPAPGWEAAFEELAPTVAAMARVQLLGSMRPGEVVRMKRSDLSTSPSESITFPGSSVTIAAMEAGGVLIWIYVPGAHKTLYRGKPKAVTLGPDAQAILAPLLEGLKPDDYVFSPQRALKERGRGNQWIHLGYSRCYAVRQYAQCITRAIDRVNAARVEVNAERKEAGKEPLPDCPYWSPNQLRHMQATVVGAKLSKEHARAILGHSSRDVVDRYVEQQVMMAAEAAAKCG